MKTLIARLSSIALVALPLLAHAQAPKLFAIADPFKKSTYDGKELRQMKFKVLKAILLAPNDPEINASIQKIKGKRALSSVVVGIGVVVMGAGGAVTGLGEDGGTAIMAGGAGILVIGTALGGGTGKHLQRAVTRYNQVVGGTSGLMPGMPDEAPTGARSAHD